MQLTAMRVEVGGFFFTKAMVVGRKGNPWRRGARKVAKGQDIVRWIM